MTKNETEYITNLANQLILYCAQNDIAREKFEERAKLIRAQFKLVTPATAGERDASQPNNAIILKSIEEVFTKKEINDMPNLKDLKYRYRERDGIHEFRYRRNGMSRSFCSRSLKEAKRKAVEFCRELNGLTIQLYTNKDVFFNDFALSFMESVKKPNVTQKTYHNDLNRLQNHVLTKTQGVRLRNVTAPFLQKLLNDLREQGKNRTAEGVFYLLKTILDYAEKTDVIRKNPILAVKIPLHVRENGKALTHDDERIFLQKIRGNEYELHFIIQLYTGCRPCELYSLQFLKEGFATFRNRKQHNGKIEYKDTPITPMLAPYVERIKQAMPLKRRETLAEVFSKLMPGYKMYDLRHTFTTRCEECGVPEEIVDKWLGHLGKTLAGKVYAHLPSKFMLEQAKKVEY